MNKPEDIKIKNIKLRKGLKSQPAAEKFTLQNNIYRTMANG
jgi:hypothetical protein